jgi:uncharacterized delta-60 repeat protein
MKILSPIFFLLSAIGCLAQPQQAWVQRYNGGFTNKTHTPLAMKLDSAGNIYVAGSSQNASNFYDYVVLKYAPNGALQWAARYSPTNGGTSPANGFALDQNGNTYLTGGISVQYPNPCVIGNGGTVKFDTNGQLAWAAPFTGNDVAADTNGNVYVIGSSTNQFATTKLDSTGSNVWTRTYVWITSPGNPVAVSQKVAVDNAGNIYMAGWADYVAYHVNIGPPPGGYWAYYMLPTVLIYDPTGNLVRAYCPFNSYYWGTMVGLIPDNQGNVYATGNGDTTYETGKIDPIGGTGWSFTGYGGQPGVRDMKINRSGNVYLTGAGNRVFSVNTSYVTFKFDTNGQTLWRTNFSGPISDGATGISLDSIDNIYVTGVSTNTTTGNDFATVKYDTNGNQQWVIRYNGPANGNDGANAIAVAPDGSIYVTGYSQNTSGGSDITTIKYAYPPTIQRKSDGSMQIQFFGAPGQSYNFQATTNFTSWNNLGSSLADTNGIFGYVDTNAPLFPNRFYRWYSPSP